MRADFLKVVFTTLALGQACSALKATILADTNHDGKVDTTDKDGDAIFIANIGDTDRRCSKTITKDTPDEDLEKCNDASDNVLRNPKYLAPVKTLPVVAQSGSISVLGNDADKNVRIFIKRSGSWAYVDPKKDTFTAEELKRGLELGVDARDIRRPNGWSGWATLRFTVTDKRGKTATDEVSMRVAPVLTHHHGQAVERVFATDGLINFGPQVQFAKDMEDQAVEAGIQEPLVLLPIEDIWMQDFFEPGYTSFPGPDGPIFLRIMIRRSSKSARKGGRQTFSVLRSDDVGAVQHIGNSNLTLEGLGNVETVPPHTHNGKSYPAGRIVMGTYSYASPAILGLLDAQEEQYPILLDTEWLAVGHVDEFIQFLPAKNELGWVMMVDDPAAGLSILQKAIRDGHGGVTALSRPFFANDNSSTCIPNVTLEYELERADLVRLNTMAAERIEFNIEILKNETGITDDDIFRVPALYGHYDQTMTCEVYAEEEEEASGNTIRDVVRPINRRVPSAYSAAAGKPASALRKRQDVSEDQVITHWAGAINGIPLSDSYYIAPNPWGPVVDGKDIIAEAVTEVYAKVNYTVKYVDDWFSLHIWDGEIHCGTNTFRSASDPWW
ncbi:hypothetical protein F66182_7637 [Fusarium sp. NRRL 66182]|nr:hypothetical protein F66182_7637 [Fusarium sp. NRRL 66182]